MAFMRTSFFSSGLAVGLIGTAATAALLAPAASGAAPSGPIAATSLSAPSAVTAPARTLLPSIPGQRLVIVHTAPAGMAFPAAPAPVVVAVPTDKVAEFGKHQVKQGYINEQQAAWQGAAAGAAQGALVGVIAGAIVGFFLPPFFIFGSIVGAFVGVVWGAVGGAVGGYINGQNRARQHNNAVRANNGQPVAARVGIPVARKSSARVPVGEMREIPTVTLPPQAHRAITDTKRAIARAFGIPIPQ